MVVELVHRLATDDSPEVKKILDNVIFAARAEPEPRRPDHGDRLVQQEPRHAATKRARSRTSITRTSATTTTATCTCSRRRRASTRRSCCGTTGSLRCGSTSTRWAATAPRIFVMPATDPINPNVHPLIYRWNGILGQSQAAALEAAGKEGIIYNSTYTNFWEGAMAWSGWWHNQIGLLTEVASARVAAPIEQQRASPARPASPAGPATAAAAADAMRHGSAPLPRADRHQRRAPSIRGPWMGGRWTLRDIVDYELIATMALLDTAADRREAILRQIYEVNRQTIEDGQERRPVGDPDPGRARSTTRAKRRTSSRSCRWAASRSTAPTRRSRPTARRTPPGTFVIPMTQVFARYAKDMLEKQTYPEVRRAPDVAARAAVRRHRLVARHAARRRRRLRERRRCRPVKHDAASTAAPSTAGPRDRQRPALRVRLQAAPTRAIAINRLLKDGAQRRVRRPVARRRSSGVRATTLEAVAREFGLTVTAAETRPTGVGDEPTRVPIHAPRVGDVSRRGPAATWTKAGRAGCSSSTSSTCTTHPQRRHPRRQAAPEVRRDHPARPGAARHRRRLSTAQTIRPEYRGGIGDDGRRRACSEFVARGRHADHARRRVRPRDRALPRAGPQPEARR